MGRKITKTYQDPLELTWLHCAKSLGIEVQRDDEVFASWDGHSKLRLGLDSLDPDDSVAQLVFHEICHALIEGPESFGQPDWGLNNIDNPAPRSHEFATLRLQASLAEPFGLRQFLAATTDFREYYDRIPKNVFDHMDLARSFENIRQVTRAEDDEAIKMAKSASANLDRSSWKENLDTALAATQKLFEVVKAYAPKDSLWHDCH